MFRNNAFSQEAFLSCYKQFLSFAKLENSIMLFLLSLIYVMNYIEFLLLSYPCLSSVILIKFRDLVLCLIYLNICWNALVFIHCFIVSKMKSCSSLLLCICFYFHMSCFIAFLTTAYVTVHSIVLYLFVEMDICLINDDMEASYAFYNSSYKGNV